MVTPSLRGTKLNMAIRSLDFGPLGKTRLTPTSKRCSQAQSARAQDPSYNARRARKWSPIVTHDGLGNVSIDFAHSGPDNFMVKGTEDEEEIADMLAELQIEGEPETLATENIQLKQALGAQQDQFTKMLNMYMGTREMVKILKARDGGAVEIHSDLLPVQCNVHLS